MKRMARRVVVTLVLVAGSLATAASTAFAGGGYWSG